MVARPSRPSGRVLEAGNWIDSQGRNIPNPWQKREWSKTRQVANLPAVVGNILTSGPTGTMYPLITINPQALTRRPRQFRSLSEIASQVTDFNESEVIAMDPRSRGIGGRPTPMYLTHEERLARTGSPNPEVAALDPRRRLPRGDTEVLRGQSEEDVRTFLGYLLNYFLGV